MTVLTSTYYGLTRVRDQSPEANDWAATDANFENLSKVMKALEQHRHTGTPAPQYPGYYTPPAQPNITTFGSVAGDATTYSYYIVAKGSGVMNKVSDTGTMTAGHATLDTTHYNTLTWATVPGATSYDVVRLVGGTSQGLIATVSGLTYDDKGAVATQYTPAGQPDVTLNDPTITPGILAPGTTLGIRLAYLNAAGLETQASPERRFEIVDAGVPPLAPTVDPAAIAAATPGIPGGSYFYVMTKLKGTGETLISEVTSVSLPYNRTSSVPLTFTPIDAYTDGTTALKIYRSSGFNEAFQLVTTITGATTSTYTDNNTIQDQTGQPPTTSTFGANQSVKISWANIPHPTSIVALRVYVTQQSGLWTTSHLLHTEPIVSGTPISTYINYIGNESLDSGAPKESTEIPDDAPLLNIGSDNLIPTVITPSTLAVSPPDGTVSFYKPTTAPQTLRLVRYNQSTAAWEGVNEPPLVSSLPTSPYNGMIVDYSADSNTTWRCRWNSSTSRWMVIGGSPLYTGTVEIAGDGPGTLTGNAVGVPRTGTYVINWGTSRTARSAAGTYDYQLYLQDTTGPTNLAGPLRTTQAANTDEGTGAAHSIRADLVGAHVLQLAFVVPAGTQHRAHDTFISMYPVYLT